MAELHAVVLRVAWAVRELVISVMWTLEVGMTKGLLGRPKMCILLVAGTEAAQEVLGYMLQATKVSAAIVWMAQTVVMGMGT